MSKGNDPAFASVWKPNEQQAHWGHKEVMHSGLTKREYFAGLAMQGILADLGRCTPNFEGTPEQYSALMAKVALEFSDRLIEELEKTA